MPIRVRCSACGTEFRISSDYLGKRFKCKECGATFLSRSPEKIAVQSSRRRRSQSASPSNELVPRHRLFSKRVAMPLVVCLSLVVGIGGTLLFRGSDTRWDQQLLTENHSPQASADPGVQNVAANSITGGPEFVTENSSKTTDSTHSTKEVLEADEQTGQVEDAIPDSAFDSMELAESGSSPQGSPSPVASPSGSETATVADESNNAASDPVESERTDHAGDLSSAGTTESGGHLAETTGRNEAALVTRVQSILEQSCHSCHGESGSNEGGMNYVLDLKRLVETGKIVARDAEKSDLMARIADGSMPPDGIEPRVSPADIALIGEWISAGAPFAEKPNRRFIDNLDVARFIRDDLHEVGERDRRFTRYFTITHLYNAGRSDDELQTYRLALGKLINSLSWERQLVHPVPVDPESTIFRIDIRDLRWKSTTWGQILAWYPYGFHINSALIQEIEEMSGAHLPSIRGDWFVAVASRPPLYHDILELPDTLQGLQDLLRIDFRQDVAQERVARAGFNESGVSEHPRIIERHETADGACWVSHDFAGSAGARNFFAHPLSFEADGGEFIFNLPNGLQAYFLADAAGQRLDKGPTSIVKDLSQPDAAVVNGVSCMRCHAAGIISKVDQVRQSALANPRAFDKQLESIQAIYPERDEFDRLLRIDQTRFADAMNTLGVARLSVTGEPVFNMARRFQDALDVELAAAEVGLTAEELDRRISTNALLQRNLGTLRVPGGTIKREAFDSTFGLLVSSLKLGTPIAPDFQRPALQIASTSQVPNPAPQTLRVSDDWFSLGSRQRWPTFLERARWSLPGRGGLTFQGRNFIRTEDRSFLVRDFTFEIVFSLSKGDKLAFVGMGEGRGRQAGDEPANSVNLRIHPPNVADGDVGLSNVGAGGTVIGRIASEGTHRAVITKVGESVTFSIDVDDDGDTPDDFERTIPNIHDYAPFLTSKNTHLFFGGDGTFQKVRLTVGAIPGSRTADARSTSSGPSRQPETDLDAFNLSTALQGKGGLTVKPRTVIRSRAGDFLTGDFQFEVIVTIPESSTREPLDRPVFIGIGEGTYDRLHEVERCVRLRMNPPGLGEGSMILARTGADGRLEQGSKQQIGQIRRAGTHKVLIHKRDHAVTFSVDVDNDGESPDDFESTIPDISEYADYLHSKNGYLFFGGDAKFSNVKLEKAQ
jgi:mono/diheme cytochrome c family protein